MLTVRNASFATVLLSCSSLTACSSDAPPADPTLGVGTLARNGTAVTVTAVWAEREYAFFDDNNDSYGAYAIMFTTDPAGNDARCSEALQLTGSPYLLELNTTQVFHQTSRSGAIQLPVGDMPVVPSEQVPSDAPPAMPVADFAFVVPFVTSGTVTICAFDGSSIAARFTVSGAVTDPISLTGDFYAPICPHAPVTRGP
jgi:hypothetical protein